MNDDKATMIHEWPGIIIMYDKYPIYALFGLYNTCEIGIHKWHGNFDTEVKIIKKEYP